VKFLFIRFSSIGDIVLTTPVVRNLKLQRPDAKIHYLTKKAFEPVLKNNPHIDRLWLMNDNLNEILEQLRIIQPDYVIDLHHNLRTARVKNKLKVAAFSFPKINLEKWLIVNFKINRLPDRHIVDRYMETLQVFDIINDEKGLDYFIPEEEEGKIKRAMKELPSKFIVLSIGAQHNTKKLPPMKLAELCRKVQWPVVVLGGKEDRMQAREIMSMSGGPSPIINLTGKTSLNVSAGLVKNAEAVVTHDTGIMHIAAAFHKRIVSIWGNTIPEFGMYPYKPHKDSRIFEIKGLSCRPCSKIGFSKCPKKHFKCMMDHDMHEIVDYVNSILKD